MLIVHIIPAATSFGGHLMPVCIVFGIHIAIVMNIS